MANTNWVERYFNVPAGARHLERDTRWNDEPLDAKTRDTVIQGVGKCTQAGVQLTRAAFDNEKGEAEYLLKIWIVDQSNQKHRRFFECEIAQNGELASPLGMGVGATSFVLNEGEDQDFLQAYYERLRDIRWDRIEYFEES